MSVFLCIPSQSINEEVLVEKEDAETQKKLREEIKRLREELASVRSENLQLKEDGLKHRIRSGISSSISGDKSLHSELSSPKSVSNPGLALSPHVLGMALLVLIAGILLGKVLF